jgi:hypothetical protein
MFDGLGRAQPAPDTDLITRAVGVPTLAALAVIHVVDLPGTLGPDRLVGIGYLGIIAIAIVAGGAMIARSYWLTWVAAGGLGVAAMTGYVLTRSLPGGFLGDHGDVGNWGCPLGIAALSVETVIILLAAGWAWQARGPRRQLGREDPVRRVPPPEYRGIQDDWPSAL